ncbi:MAG TPA: hypothetical protein VGJ93_01100 [Desulfuromonadaceae bacterium]|jgi:hypothetical protein
MAGAAVKTKNQIVVSDDIEYAVIGNFLGVLIAAGGVLAGAMVSQRSFQYWQDDIVPLGLLLWMGYRLLRNGFMTMIVYQEAPRHHPAPVSKETIQREHAVVAQLPAAANFTPEQALDEVVKRIEAQKAEVAKKNKD